MKTLACLFCFCLLGAVAAAQTGTLLQFRAVEHVIDESGHPVAGALAVIGYYTNSQSVTAEKITGTDGLFEFQDTSPSEYADYSFEARKDGYYSIWQQVNLQSPYNPAKWNMEKTLVLKKIGQPIAMYAKKYAMALKLPEYWKRIGYDLMVGDWVGPYGKGVSADVMIEQDYTNLPSGGYYSKITVTFPKAGDGIQLYTIPDSEVGSGLRSPHEGPLNGYQPEITRETSALPGQPNKFEFDPNRIYLFRVRTVKDHEGNIVSAHYGKIYGDFMQFTYYLNPTPNSRNIEFDPKQNLLGGLQSFEQVTVP
jgi:hypothetical protein